MLEVVGHPHAVNPDKELARVATERDWPILRFTTPIAMRRRIPRVGDLDRRQRAVAVSTLVATAAVTSGVIWYATRRSRQHRAYVEL